jgi:hypothetical protein
MDVKATTPMDVKHWSPPEFRERFHRKLLIPPLPASCRLCCSNVRPHIRRAFEWVQESHKPAVFDDDEFNMIRKAVPFPKRVPREMLSGVASLAGYVAQMTNTGVYVINDTSTTSLFDMSHIARMIKGGFRREVNWFQFRSAMAFSVTPDVVICVLKNRRRAFTYQDVEFTHMYRTAFSEILGGSLGKAARTR